MPNVRRGATTPQQLLVRKKCPWSIHPWIVIEWMYIDGYIDGYIPLSIDQYRWIHSAGTNRHLLMYIERSEQQSSGWLPTPCKSPRAWTR